ncbi:MAG: PDZ domain-containing protein [Microthrixaceae bacterium]|nr:PDZ domain-containing protein [Microthrixaceae bacterium]
MELQAPSGSPAEMSPRPAVGDSLRIVHFDSTGHRRSSQVRVDDVAMIWSRPDHTVANGVMALSGDTADTGVVVDPGGAVAGLVIGTADGRSVAFSSDTLRKLLDRLRSGGTVEHPWIGVRAGDVPARAESASTPVGGPSPGTNLTGAVVVEVVPGSPAQASGVSVGDLVTAVGGQPVHGMEDLLAAVAPLSPGDEVPLDIIRAGSPVRLQVVVGVFPE